jgi:hypothetical protein
MFVGSVPQQVVEQILRVSKRDWWTEAYVCCSGSFRVDGALKSKWPELKVHSNDISLLSVALGRLAIRDPLIFTFTGRLAFIEDFLTGRAPLERVSAILVAMEMARYSGNNEYAGVHWTHYQAAFPKFLDKANKKIGEFLVRSRVDSFSVCDFRIHAARAVRSGGCIVAFPPTYKGGYERMYKLLDQNTEWERPAYDIWDPAGIEEWITELANAGARYCVFADQRFEELKPSLEFLQPTNKPIYVYANFEGSSLRRRSNNATPFRYQPVVPQHLRHDTAVTIAVTDGPRMNYLKDVYLAKHIYHVAGMFNFLVYLDKKLAGGIIMSRSKWGDTESIYMLSDFSVTREGRISKLIAGLAVSEEIMRWVRTRLLQDVRHIFTTAFTDKPVSMKYRGVFALHSRKPGQLQYRGDARGQTAQQIYEAWWARNAAKHAETNVPG